MRGKWAAVLALAIGNLIVALLAAAPLSPPLARALDDRPAATLVAGGADDGPRAELLEDHPELISTAIESGILALLIWGALSFVAAGGLLSDEPFIAGCIRNARRMLAMGLMGMPLRLLALVGPLMALPFVGGAHDFASVRTGTWIGVIVGGLLWSMAGVTIDRAKGKALARPELRPWQALRSGLAASRARMKNTFYLASISSLGFALLVAAHLAGTHWLPPTTLGATVALLVALLAAVGRAALSAWILFAANP